MTKRKRLGKLDAETTFSPGSKIPIQASRWFSAEEVAEILQERTANLAQVAQEMEKEQIIHIVVLALGEENYAVEATYVRGIFALENLSPVPCTPDFVAGVVNLRGRIISVIDIQRFLGFQRTEIDDYSQVVVVSARGLEVGLLARVREMIPLPASELRPVLPTATRIAAEYTRGITSRLIVLLDLENLLGDERLIVQEQA
ncbi:MAG: chemotaxis protein CheW [Anaerolineae bacterium]|nr:chemotaxis protein CheW [Anaerolineae bacterium]